MVADNGRRLGTKDLYIACSRSKLETRHSRDEIVAKLPVKTIPVLAIK
jgi:hypothetical protein